MAAYTSPVEGDGRTGLSDLTAAVEERFGSAVSPMPAGHGYVLALSLAQPGSLPSLCRFLFWDRGCQFGGMIAEEHSSHWQLHYAFLLPRIGMDRRAALLAHRDNNRSKYRCRSECGRLARARG